MSTPTKKKRASVPPLKLVKATPEEEQQLADIAAGHPWTMTLRDFLEKLESNYGFKYGAFFVTDPDGRSVRMPYVVNQSGRKIPLPGLTLEDQLDPFVTASLCRLVKVPPEDFGLPAEP